MREGDAVIHQQYGVGVIKARTAQTLPSYEYVQFVGIARRVQREKLELIEVSDEKSE